MTSPRSRSFHFDEWSRFDTTQEVDLGINDWTDTSGNPIYAPVSSRHPGWQRFTNWNDLGPWGRQLRARETKMVYLSPDGRNLWNLAGNWAGKEGVILDEKLKGSQGVPFEHRYSSGPYMIGEELERTDYRKRVIDWGIHIGPSLNILTRRRHQNNEFSYRMLEEKWWADWPENYRSPAGFIGEYTRTHGWRWLRVRLGEATNDTLDRDPTAFDNNQQSWSMTIHAQFPFYSKRPWTREWRNDDLNAQLNGRNHGVIPFVNRGDWAQWPKFIVEGSGTVSIQDGVIDRMVELPKILPADGMILVDTDPSKRTLTASTDPVDNLFYKIIRNSEILDYLLNDLTNADSGIAIGRRMPGGIGFTSQIPGHSNAVLKVTHTNPAGKITGILPQWYRSGFA